MSWLQVHIQKYMLYICLGNSINWNVSILDLIQIQRKKIKHCDELIEYWKSITE